VIELAGDAEKEFGPEISVQIFAQKLVDFGEFSLVCEIAELFLVMVQKLPDRYDPNVTVFSQP